MTLSTQAQAGCITKDIAGQWLFNGHLEVCLLKLAAPSDNQLKNDESRPENLAMLTSLLQANSAAEKSLLEQENPGKPVIILAPELAFGSSDFVDINSLVKQCSQNLIFICGFGFTAGAVLSDLVSKENVEGIWNNLPNSQKKYNGGWVWVKEEENVRCYVSLKNFLEQGVELSVPNLDQGDQILRLEGKDIIVFPTICADLISSEVSSPRKRIENSLTESCSSNKKTLITGSLLNNKSSSGWWKTAIGDLLDSNKGVNPRLLLSNCMNPWPVEDEEEDKWRCLSGAYQHIEGSRPPKISLPNIRYVNDAKFSGLLVRNSVLSCVFGKLNWSNNQAEGLNVLSPGSQYVRVNNSLLLCGGECAADELFRFILRHKAKFYNELITLNNQARILAETKLDNLLAQLSPGSRSPIRKEAGLLFLKCLKGVDKKAVFNPDKLHTEKVALDCAITTLVIIQHALDGELLPEGKQLDQGQILSSDGQREVLIWDSSEHTPKRLHEMVAETVVKDGGSFRPLTVIGRGNSGGMHPPDGRIRSTRLADITDASPLSIPGKPVERDICGASDRVVYWKNQGEIDEILASTKSGQNIEVELKSEISSVEEL
jgi:hypothetical protein